MNLNLPDVDWRSRKMTLPGQLKKLFEEAGEVAEAVAKDDPVNTIKEALDTIQTCMTLIDMVRQDYRFSMDQFVGEHVAKLERKGYLKHEPSSYKDSSY